MLTDPVALSHVARYRAGVARVHHHGVAAALEQPEIVVGERRNRADLQRAHAVIMHPAMIASVAS